MDETFHVFTDGSAIGNPGPGGWAAVLIRGGKELGDVGFISLDNYLGDGVDGGHRGPALHSTGSDG